MGQDDLGCKAETKETMGFMFAMLKAMPFLQVRPRFACTSDGAPPSISFHGLHVLRCRSGCSTCPVVTILGVSSRT